MSELGLDEGVAQLLASAEPVTDEVLLSGDRLLAVNIRPTSPHGGEPGSVVTLRDTTELSAVSGRAQVARERLKLLYESGVRIGTTLDVARTATELAQVAVPRFSDLAAVDLLDEVVRGQEPAFRRRSAGCAGWRSATGLRGCRCTRSGKRSRFGPVRRRSGPSKRSRRCWSRICTMRRSGCATTRTARGGHWSTACTR